MLYVGPVNSVMSAIPRESFHFLPLVLSTHETLLVQIILNTDDMKTQKPKTNTSVYCMYSKPDHYLHHCTSDMLSLPSEMQKCKLHHVYQVILLHLQHMDIFSSSHIRPELYLQNLYVLIKELWNGLFLF